MADDAQRAPQILIASLFLPKSVNLSPSGSPGATPSIPSTPKQRAVDVLPLPKITPSSIINAPVAKLRSIVEDLTVKASFSSLYALSAGAAICRADLFLVF